MTDFNKVIAFTYVTMVAFSTTWAQTLPLTPSQTEGPYYAPNPPFKPDFRPDVEEETPADWPDLLVTGQVLNQYGQPVANAKLDFWHADASGEYDESSVGGRDGTYILRGYLFADEQGNYEYNSIMPGLYPGRTRHVHFKVFDDQDVERLTSQFYWESPFDNDVNADRTLDIPNGTPLTRDGLYRNTSELLVTINNDPVAEGYFDTSFDIVIDTPFTPLSGDFDGDGDVDTADRTILTQNWTGALPSGTGSRLFADGDNDGDGDVDSADQTALAIARTGAVGGATARSQVVPEPPSALLALAAACLCLTVRRQRHSCDH